MPTKKKHNGNFIIFTSLFTGHQVNIYTLIDEMFVQKTIIVTVHTV